MHGECETGGDKGMDGAKFGPPVVQGEFGPPYLELDR